MDRTRTNPRWLSPRRLTPAFAALVAIAAVGCGSSGPDVSAAPRHGRQTRRPRRTTPAPPARRPCGTAASSSRCPPTGRSTTSRPLRVPACASTSTPCTSVIRAPTCNARPRSTVTPRPCSSNRSTGRRTSRRLTSTCRGRTASRSRSIPRPDVENQLRAALPTAGLAVTVTFEDSDLDAHQILESFRPVTP